MTVKKPKRPAKRPPTPRADLFEGTDSKRGANPSRASRAKEAAGARVAAPPRASAAKPPTKLARPGVYDRVPMEQYHGDTCPGASMSASDAVNIMRSPAYAFVRSYMASNRVDDTTN